MGIDKLRAITYFVRTVQAGSFAAAAREIDLNPSALSKALTSLDTSSFDKDAYLTDLEAVVKSLEEKSNSLK